MTPGCTTPANGATAHWSAIPGVRELPWQREVEAHFRAGFARSAGIVAADADMPQDRLDWLLTVVESARSLLRRRGPGRAAGLALPHDWSRWALAAYLRGLSHGLQYARSLRGCAYELQVWSDAVDDWAAGDPDVVEFPPAPACVANTHEVSA